MVNNIWRIRFVNPTWTTISSTSGGTTFLEYLVASRRIIPMKGVISTQRAVPRLQESSSQVLLENGTTHRHNTLTSYFATYFVVVREHPQCLFVDLVRQEIAGMRYPACDVFLFCNSADSCAIYQAAFTRHLQ